MMVCGSVFCFREKYDGFGTKIVHNFCPLQAKIVNIWHLHNGFLLIFEDFSQQIWKLPEIFSKRMENSLQMENLENLPIRNDKTHWYSVTYVWPDGTLFWSKSYREF